MTTKTTLKRTNGANGWIKVAEATENFVITLNDYNSEQRLVLVAFTATDTEPSADYVGHMVNIRDGFIRAGVDGYVWMTPAFSYAEIDVAVSTGVIA